MIIAAGAAVVGLLLISVALSRTLRQKWLLRWNLAWLAYLIHLPFGHLVVHQGGSAVSLMVAGTLCLASQAGIALAMLSLAWKPQHERRLLSAAGVALLFYLGLHPWMEQLWMMEIIFGLFGLISVALAWVYTRSRGRPGGWLLMLALLLRVFHTHRAAFLDNVSTLDALDLVTAVFALAAGLAVVVEEMQEQTQWRSAGALISTSLASGNAGPEFSSEPLKTDFHRLVRAVFSRLLLEKDPEFQRLISWIPSSEGPASVVLRTMTEIEQASVFLGARALRGLALIPLKASARTLGLLAVGYERPMLGAPADLEIMDQLGRQAGMALESAQLLEFVSHAHQEWMDTVNSLADLVLVHGEDGRIERVNRALASRLDLVPEQMVGRFCREVLPGAGQRWTTCPFCETPGTAGYYDPGLRGHFLVSTSGRSVGGGCLHIVKDISDRRMAEERYQYIFENVREGLFISTPEGRLLDCNEALARLLGYSREELLRLNIPTDIWVSAEDRKRQQEMINRQDYLEDYEVRLRHRNGQEVVALETSFATRDESGKVVRYQGFLVDITERLKAEGELRRHNEILTKVHDLTERLMHSLDKEQVLRSVVEELRRLFEFDTVAVYVVEESRLEAARAAATGFSSPLGQQFTHFQISAENVAAIRQAQHGVMGLEEIGSLGPDIRAVQMAEGLQSVSVLPLVGPSLLGVIVCANRRGRVLTLSEETLLGNLARQVRDALENALLYEHARRAYEDLRQTQERLLQSEKMAALGQLVSGVAHELNNPLAAIIGYAQLLSSHVTGKGADYIEKLLRQSQRTQKIIQDLLSFSRQRKPERTALDLNRVVEDLLLLREYELQGKVTLVRQYGQLPAVLADRTQIEQVCLNIISNAVDAMENQPAGTLMVRTYMEERPVQLFSGARLGGPPSGHVVLEFADDGPGVKDPARVFDPFYTTKKVGRGTGLGLSICYGIVKEHGGEIEVASGHPHGAIFRVRLPAVPVAAEPATA